MTWYDIQQPSAAVIMRYNILHTSLHHTVINKFAYSLQATFDCYHFISSYVHIGLNLSLSPHSTHVKMYTGVLSWYRLCHHWCHQRLHDYVIKWKHFPYYRPFVWGIHRSPVNSPHKGQWRGALMCPLICAWKNGWVNNHEAGDLRRHHAHCDVIVMVCYDDKIGTKITWFSV